MARIVTVARCVALFYRLGGPDAAARAVRQRAGRLFDPAVVDAFGRHAVDVLGELAPFASADRLLDLEPQPHSVDAATVLRTFGEAVDLKAPFLHGHSTGRIPASSWASARPDAS